MGKEFAEHVNEHLKEKGMKTKTIGVIKLNPEQSKHLETATLSLFDTWVDFVNLRSESYEADSRIPDKIVSPQSEEFVWQVWLMLMLMFVCLAPGIWHSGAGCVSA